MSKTLYFLIGPKGSGKTFIGTHVNKSTDIYFLRVEQIWIALKENENGWQKVIEEIHQSFTKYEKAKEYNEIASKVTLNWNLVVDNNGFQNIDNIAKMIMDL
jgi:shikimate kinase